MNLDGLALYTYTKALKNACLNGLVQKVLQPDSTSLVLKFSLEGKNSLLVITIGQVPACYVTSQLEDLPKEPSSLCMFLRKHLEGARIVDVKQINFDRIIKISFAKQNLKGELESKEMYIELMGKHSNCIIVEDDIILESLKHVSPYMSQERSISPKIQYTLPPHADRLSITDFTAKEAKEMLFYKQEKSIEHTVRALFNGFGSHSMKELFFRARLGGKENHILSETECFSLANALDEIGKEIIHSHSFYKYSINNKNTNKDKSIYSSILLTYIESPCQEIKNLFPVIEKEVLSTGTIGTSQKNLLEVVKKHIKKELLRSEKITQELLDIEKADMYKMYGDLLMIYSYMPVSYEKEVELENLLTVPEEKIIVPIKPALSMSENATLYYKKYTKLKNRYTHGTEQLKESQKKMDYLESLSFSLEKAKNKEDISEIKEEMEHAGILKVEKKKLSFLPAKEAYITKHVQNGTIYVGKNNKQNEFITHRLGKPNDLWFHAQKMPGSHVLLRSNGEHIEEDIYMAASYAAYYSKGSEDSAVPVDYTYIKFVKKPPRSPLGYVIYTNQNTIMASPKKNE